MHHFCVNLPWVMSSAATQLQPKRWVLSKIEVDRIPVNCDNIAVESLRGPAASTDLSRSRPGSMKCNLLNIESPNDIVLELCRSRGFGIDAAVAQSPERGVGIIDRGRRYIRRQRPKPWDGESNAESAARRGCLLVGWHRGVGSSMVVTKLRARSVEVVLRLQEHHILEGVVIEMMEQLAEVLI
ncbi:hypothetical protein K438DRAFT_1767886 [Mycena galopus ATCC 62051]|nr:hypothetical protein K438DRAFT_1767886 [Mycena galopus ATCC 62051]